MIANKGASGLHCNPPGSGWLWAHLTCGKKALAKIGDLGEARDRQIMSLPRPRPDMQPAAFGGFAISDSGFRKPRRDGRKRAVARRSRLLQQPQLRIRGEGIPKGCRD